jgi:transposase
MSSTPTRDNKRDRVIDLYKEGKNMREIAKDVHMSFSVIGKIIRESNGQTAPEPEKPKSNRAKAFQMFTEGKDTIEVLQILDLGYNEVMEYYGEYLTLKNMIEFIDFYRKNQRYIPFLLKVIEKLRNRELFDTEADILIDYLSQIHYFDSIKDQLQHEINCLLLDKKVLEDEIKTLEDIKAKLSYRPNRFTCLSGDS